MLLICCCILGSTLLFLKPSMEHRGGGEGSAEQKENEKTRREPRLAGSCRPLERFGALRAMKSH
jgi:hypothetical protein